MGAAIGCATEGGGAGATANSADVAHSQSFGKKKKKCFHACAPKTGAVCFSGFKKEQNVPFVERVPVHAGADISFVFAKRARTLGAPRRARFVSEH